MNSNLKIESILKWLSIEDLILLRDRLMDNLPKRDISFDVSVKDKTIKIIDEDILYGYKVTIKFSEYYGLITFKITCGR